MKSLTAVLILSATSAYAALLPGFAVQPVVAVPSGFVSSIVTDSHGTLYYTTTAGDIVRFSNGEASVVAHVHTTPVGNSGLLGMALRNDQTAIVHYTTPLQTYDVISSIDLRTGAETIVHSFLCNEFEPALGASAEHHGGNPIVADGGSIFVAIGDGNSPNTAPSPDWNLGKVFRIRPDGGVEQLARGVRNPFDVAWDAAGRRLIVPDNGDKQDDEINIVDSDDDLGWPYTMGNEPSVAGTVPPVYVFPTVIAPTGLVALNGSNPVLSHGYLLGAFVTKAIYYIADVDAAAPIAMIAGATGPIVDVTEAPDGSVYFASGQIIYRLIVPQRGDCNGDGRVDENDLPALLAEVGEGAHATTTAQEGAYAGTWGCDAGGDGVIDEHDIKGLMSLLHMRMRSVRH